MIIIIIVFILKLPPASKQYGVEKDNNCTLLIPLLCDDTDEKPVCAINKNGEEISFAHHCDIDMHACLYPSEEWTFTHSRLCLEDRYED